MYLHWFCFFPIIAEVVLFIKREVLPTSRGNCAVSMWGAGNSSPQTHALQMQLQFMMDSFSLHPVERQGAGAGEGTLRGHPVPSGPAPPLTQQPWKERPLVKRGGLGRTQSFGSLSLHT